MDNIKKEVWPGNPSETEFQIQEKCEIFHPWQVRLVGNVHPASERVIFLSSKASVSNPDDFTDHKHCLNFKTQESCPVMTVNIPSEPRRLKLETNQRDDRRGDGMEPHCVLSLGCLIFIKET